MKILFSVALLLIVNVSNAQNDQCTCCTDNHEEFDFWVGNWTVTNPDGAIAGKNKIEKIQNNCVLQENWTSEGGTFTGTSFNFYNRESKQWEQIWIDSNGSNLSLKGNREGNKMILRSDDLKNEEGEPFFHRITWTHNDDGTVRQYWETIKNNTEITVAFDGLYKKTQ